ncbi:methyltransferase domain-containing protein [Methylophaga sp.]|uniref:class I SAM-dependent methyltransferase n=1 Tax=Methylophaga sp. TaxID=2024840 RepID=UPI0025DAD5A8|nr:methyltransferase domain-containing protein [Methylophaga sp.]
MDNLKVWGIDIPTEALSQSEIDYLASLPEKLPSVKWVWQEMDRVWDKFGLDNKKSLSNQSIGDYYSHPIWLMNGIFTQLDPISVAHRKSIASFLRDKKVAKIADYGGGFGEMALTLNRIITDSEVTVVEPYPSTFGLERLKNTKGIVIRKDLPRDSFDAVIAQDVLEHVEDPVLLAWELTESVHVGGIVIFANCFFPYIKCHLPDTFHLRHTFPWMAKRMGLKYIGVIPGAFHAQVFIKIRPAELSSARKVEHISKRIALLLNNPLSTILSKVKRRLIRR